MKPMPVRIRPLCLHDLATAIAAPWNDGALERVTMHDLPRRFHGSSRERQASVLSERPAVTGTRWDALLAAMVEHLAVLHGHPIPAWVEEPERFLATTWLVSDIRSIQDRARAYCPAAFIRHGALPDPGSGPPRRGTACVGP